MRRRSPQAAFCHVPRSDKRHDTPVRRARMREHDHDASLVAMVARSLAIAPPLLRRPVRDARPAAGGGVDAAFHRSTA